MRRASDGRSPLLNHRAATANVPIRIRIALKLLPAIAMLLPGTVVVAQPDATPRVQALRSAHSGASDTTLRELRSIAKRKETTVLATRIEALLGDQSLEPAARERLLETGAILLGGLAPDANARRLLERISKLEPQTWVWLEEGGHRAAVPLYDPAAAARVAQRGWRAREYETRLVAKLAAAEQGLIDDLARARPAERTGALSAVARTPDTTLLRLKPELMAALERGAAVGWFAAEVAARTGDTDLARSVIKHAGSRDALDMLAALGERLGPEGALPLLRLSLRDPALASHSLFILARFGPVSPDAMTLIWKELENQDNGGSAAAALARVSDPAVAVRAAAIVADPARDSAHRRRALLSLCLDGGDIAQRHLQLLTVSLDDSDLGREARQCAGR